MSSTTVHYGTGEREYHDPNRDPVQLDNRIDQIDPAMLGALAQRMAELMNGASHFSQEVEDAPIEPRWSPLAAE